MDINRRMLTDRELINGLCGFILIGEHGKSIDFLSTPRRYSACAFYQAFTPKALIELVVVG